MKYILDCIVIILFLGTAFVLGEVILRKNEDIITLKCKATGKVKIMGSDAMGYKCDVPFNMFCRAYETNQMHCIKDIEVEKESL